MRATTLLAALIGAAAAGIAVLAPPSDSDLFWHLASGDWMLDHGRLLDHDVFSFTRAGAPYASGQWLGQVALALAFRAGGWAGIAALRALLVGALAFFAARVTLRLQAHPAWALPPLLLALLVTRTGWGDRPQLWSLALLPLLLDVLLAARLAGRIRRLALVPPLLLLWANLHGAFVLGCALVAIFAIEALLSRTRPRAFALALGAGVVATLANPAAAGALAWAGTYAARPAAFIVEERPPDILSGPGLVFAALLVAALAAALLLGRDGLARTLGAPLLWPGLVVPFVCVGLAVQRQLPYACLVLAPFVAAALPAAVGRTPRGAPHVPAPLAAAVLAALGCAVAATALVGAPREPDLAAYPVGALTALRSTRGPLLNEYDWGGFLIREAPERPVFVDGRGALLFLPGVLDDFERTVRVREGFREPLARWGIREALLRPERPLVEVLRSDGWRVLASGARFVLLEKP